MARPAGLPLFCLVLCLLCTIGSARRRSDEDPEKMLVRLVKKTVENLKKMVQLRPVEGSDLGKIFELREEHIQKKVSSYIIPFYESSQINSIRQNCATCINKRVPIDAVRYKVESLNLDSPVAFQILNDALKDLTHIEDVPLTKKFLLVQIRKPKDKESVYDSQIQALADVDTDAFNTAKESLEEAIKLFRRTRIDSALVAFKELQDIAEKLVEYEELCRIASTDESVTSLLEKEVFEELEVDEDEGHKKRPVSAMDLSSKKHLTVPKPIIKPTSEPIQSSGIVSRFFNLFSREKSKEKEEEEEVVVSHSKKQTKVISKFVTDEDKKNLVLGTVIVMNKLKHLVQTIVEEVSEEDIQSGAPWTDHADSLKAIAIKLQTLTKEFLVLMKGFSNHQNKALADAFLPNVDRYQTFNRVITNFFESATSFIKRLEELEQALNLRKEESD